MKFIVYGQEDGKVWRDLDQYITEDDSTIFGGINGVNTLRYPPAVNVAVMEIADEAWAALDQDHLDKYIVQDGQIVADSTWSNESEEYQAGYDKAVLDMIEQGVL